MICPQCRYEFAYSSGACPRCGAPWRAGPIQETGIRTPGNATRHGRLAAYAEAPGRAQAFSFDPVRWTTTDRITGAATLVLLVSLFLPWFTASASLGALTSSSSADALTAHRYLYLVLLVALLLIGYLIAYAGQKDTPGMRAGHERLLAAASGINLLLVLIAVIFKPPGITPMWKMSWNVGAFIGLIAAIVAVVPLARSGLRARRPRLAK